MRKSVKSVKNLEKSMKNSSASTEPASDDDDLLAFCNQELQALVSAARICGGKSSRDVIHGGGNDSKFITVKRSKRHLDGNPARKVSVPFPPLTPKSRGSEGNFVDPFGLSLISAEVNPVTYARTKQSVRQHTAGGSGVMSSDSSGGLTRWPGACDDLWPVDSRTHCQLLA
jgi:hypothetical protein